MPLYNETRTLVKETDISTVSKLDKILYKRPLCNMKIIDIYSRHNQNKFTF